MRVSVPVRHFRLLPLAPRPGVLGGFHHAGTIARAAAAVLRHRELRVPDLAEHRHLVDFFGDELEEFSAAVRGAQGGSNPEDVIEDAVDAFGKGAEWVTVNFHEEKDGVLVVVVDPGVPDPGSKLRICVECGGTLAYYEAGLYEPVGS